jgi:glutathione S-transferase
MTSAVTIVGSYISPYVRKVLAVLHLKGIAYQIDPIVPFFGNDQFSEMSPLRRIPVYSDGKVTLCDSTVICEYLEDLHPARAGSRSSRTRAWER